jgi:hypothetical protein
MRANTPLLTDSSRLASQQNVDNYSVGVASHINGDWSQHVQLAVINVNWVDSAQNTIPNSKRLRILATVDGVSVALVVPIVPFSAGTAGNGPQITTQPSNMSVKKGGSVLFAIQAVGDPALVYQWRYAQSAIPGAVSPQLALTNIQISQAGQYDCVVSNPFGVIVSNTITLTVTTK